MATERRPFTQEEINHAWSKAKEVPGFDATNVRKDYAGAWIKYDEYGKQNTFGWEVDSIL